MTISALVVTPSPSFGELIRRSLEDTKEYRVFVVTSKAAAIVRADEESCKMAFLDLDMGEQWVEEVGLSLRTVLSDIKILVLVQNETPPALDRIRPWTLVNKPFEVPELLSAVDGQQIPLDPPKKMDLPSTTLPWVEDVGRAAQHLMRLTLETSAQAALITQNNALWAYAGQLSQDAAQEVTRALARTWMGQKGSDLLRFIRLDNTHAEHMLYATELAEGVLLAMVFDAETPFSTIRSQADQLASSLGNHDTGEETIEVAEWPRKIKPSSPGSTSDSVEVSSEEIDVPRIADILTDIPAPRAEVKNPAPQEQTSIFPEFQQPYDPDVTHRSVFSRESSPPIPLQSLRKTDESPARRVQSAAPPGELDMTAPSKFQARPEAPVRPPRTGELDATRPYTKEEISSGGIVLEPASSGVYHLPYACLLLPRFTSHYLTGDIPDRLSEWLPNICIAYGWRLEYLAVRPEYLQWVVNVPPASAPGNLMRIIRQQTSERIFLDFLKFKKENPSGDFWAPGYLIMGGTQPHPPQLVKDYIRQIRQRQGLEKPRR